MNVPRRVIPLRCPFAHTYIRPRAILETESSRISARRFVRDRFLNTSREAPGRVPGEEGEKKRKCAREEEKRTSETKRLDIYEAILYHRDHRILMCSL